MEKTRRNFLKIAGVSALGLSAGPVVNAIASASAGHDATSAKAPKEAPAAEEKSSMFSKKSSALTAKRWAMVIDTRKLNDKLNAKIEKACHAIHNVPDNPNPRHEIKWIWDDSYGHVFPMREHEHVNEKLKNTPLLALCNHCQNPPCVQACPTQATFQREDGIVLMDFHRCIGCRFCMAACPYGSRSFNFVDPRKSLKTIAPEFPTRMKGVVEKCNFCAERLAVGKQPACVEASDGAIVFGDLDDPNSKVRQALKSNYTIRRKQSLGTGPTVYYIV